MMFTPLKTTKVHFINVVTTKFELEKFKFMVIVYQMIKDTIVTNRNSSQGDKLNGCRII